MAQRQLESGESVDLGTRVGGGPTIRRDRYVSDAYEVNGARDVLGRDEIKQLAELAGFEVSEGGGE